MKEIRGGGAPLSRLIPNNLPKSLTSFVGREAEIEDLRERIFAGGLITLTGGGGSGKTRLAMEVAHSVADGVSAVSERFRDGVWLVELDALVEESLVAPEVASVLGVGERRSGDMVRELPEILRGRRALIVLDNCEHLAGACAALCEALLKRCPRIAILATSREPLGVPGETVHPVPPLSVPESLETVESVVGAESVRLFVQRSSAVWADFELTGENAGAVVEVCAILDGIPLAIELAASRMNIMTPKEIAARLDDALGLLAAGPRTAPRRQSTLRAAIDWSYDLLPDAERAALRALAIFSGGFTLQAAEEVCREAYSGDAAVLDLIQSLVGRSLLRVQRTGDTSRYRFQEVIRQYAAEKLGESGEAEALAMRHAMFFYGFAREAEHGLSYPDPTLWLGFVDLELDNLRQAMKWMVDAGEVDGALHIPSALAWFWLRRGRLIEARSFIERAFALGEGDPIVTAAALHVLGGLAWAQGDSKAAEPLLREAIARLRELKDFEFQDVWLSSSFFTLSLELLGSGKVVEAVSVAEESISVLREDFMETSSSARGFAALGVARLAAGDVSGAREPLERSAAICRRIGDDWTLSFPLDNLAAISLLEGDVEQAYALTRESVSALRGLEDRWLLSVSLSYLATTIAARGEARRAAMLFGFGDAMREEVGQREVYAHYRTVHDRGMNEARIALGDEEFAAAWYEGRAMKPEAAMNLALVDGGDDTEETTPALVISTLGGFRVEMNGQAIEASAWRYAKVRELFVYLVCNAPAGREKIGLDLWPEAGGRQLRDALGNAMYRIRKALNGAADPFRHENGRYHFDRTEPYTLDVEEFEEESRRARNENDIEPAVKHLEVATELYRGDFLEGESGGEWVFYRQQELREIHTKSQILLGDLHTKNNAHENARDAYKRAATHDPYSTAAHAGILRSYIKQGETGRALEHYGNLQKTFREDLGAEPPREIVAIIERLRNSDWD